MPVVTLTKNNSITLDTYIDSSQPNGSFSSGTPLVVGVSTSTAQKDRILIKFDLGLIPNDAIINSATLNLTEISNNAASSQRTIGVHKVTSVWDNSVTWNTSPTFDNTPINTFLAGTSSTAKSVSITQLVQQWVNGTPNYGMLLKDEDETTINTSFAFASFDNGTSAYWPTLTIDYTIPSTGKKCVEYAGNAVTGLTGQSSITASLPGGTQPGDLLIAQVTQSGSNPASITGWTTLYQGVNAGNHLIAYKFATVGEPNPVFTNPSSVNWKVVIHRFKNVKRVDRSGFQFANLTAFFSPPNTGAITKTNLLAVTLAVNGTVSTSFTPPLNFAEGLDNNAAPGTATLTYSYLYDKTSLTSADMSMASGSGGSGYAGYILLEPITNNVPTLTITSPSDNLTLSEGNALPVAGEASDADANNNVVIRCQINNGPIRNIGSGVSDGVTPISFARTLTYRNKRLWDGATDVAGADLAEGIDHILKVWAEDDQGGKSAEVTRKFRVIWNRPPSISGSDADLGIISTPPSQVYSVTEPEGEPFIITEYLDGEVLRSFAGVDGQQYTVTIPTDKWLRTSLAQHTLKVRATDSQGLYSERTYTFTRSDNRIELTLDFNDPNIQNFFILDDKPLRILVTLDGTFPSGSNVLVEACNNFLDDTPTWEDITGPTLAGRGYIFHNTTKTAAQWAINIRVTIEKGTATEPVILNGFGGAFD
ncbi:DNRLRE domain-containing protein [Brevibacillus aydinogluensis]|uniref:DNRLRE domain-containing protein n=1 Tax=Brevibacillus aydinogluensis TaxID=927786 RepID=A0AA48MCM8_9BACL|nr:DNRLRE domain-containing protein [Brevibacillus aydinogluensis]CAJ1003867.1 DNRLRE domain-containing protein [Brevibacillus aydinogluensis]